MPALRDDLSEIIKQDVAYARTKLKLFREVVPKAIRNALDVWDDKLTDWSVKSTVKREDDR